MSVQGNDKGIDDPSFNGLEKLDTSVTERASVNINYLPIKKRRPLLRSPSPSPSPSPPLQTPVDDISAPHDSVVELVQLTLNNLVGEQINQSIESALVNKELPNTENSSGVPLFSAGLCKGTDVHTLSSIVGEEISQGIEGTLVNKKLPHTEDDSGIPLFSTGFCKGTGVDMLNSLVGEQINQSIEGTLVKKELPHTDSSGIPLLTTCFCEGIGVHSLNSLVGEQISQNIEGTLVKEELPHTDSSGIPLSASFCKGNDVDNANVGVSEDKLLMPLATDTSMDNQSLEKATAYSEGENLTREENISEAHHDLLDQIGSSIVSPSFLDKTENDAEKSPSFVKDIKFHWDLNTVMDEWDSPGNDRNLVSQRNGTCSISGGSLQIEESNNSQNLVGLKYYENASELVTCNSHIESHGLLMNEPKHPYKSNYPEQPLEGKVNASTKLTMLARKNIFSSATQFNQKLPMKNVKLEHDAVLADSVVLGKTSSEMIRIKLQEEYTKLHNLPSNGSTVSTFSIPADADNLSGKSEKTILHHALSDKKIVSQPVLDCIKKEKDISDPLNVTSVESSLEDVVVPKSYELLGPSSVANLANPSSDVETKELMPKSYEHFGEVVLEDTFDDGDVSDISLGGHDHLVRLKNVTKSSIGCESPFEDGELRDTVALSWEENDCEPECLDYDNDDRDAYDFGTGNLCISEAGSESIQNDDNDILPEKGTCGSANSLKESSNSASVENVSEKDQIAVTIEANNSKTDEIAVSDSKPKRSFSEEIRSRETREKLSSRVGESPASGAFNEKDTIYMQQGRSGSRFQAGQMFRSDKYVQRDRYVPRMQDERHKNNWGSVPSSYIESRNHFQNNYRRGGGFLRPRNTVPDSDISDEGLAYRDQRRSTNYSEKGMYRPLVRKRPLDNNGNTCSTHRGNIESREDEVGMIRGRTGVYHPGGGFKGDDSAPSSGWVPARRRRSTSPLRNRNPSFSRPCRRSRSRSQEERNKGPRMERNRIHYDDSKFENNDEPLLSSPRKRFSSQGGAGFFNDRNGGPSHFRGRNSPGRFIGQRRGFDSRDHVERVKSDDGFGPKVHPQRFSKPSGEVWRGHDYDNNDNERTKYRDRNDMIRRVRHCDNDGPGRRFRSEADDCFDMRNNRNNNDWEGRGHYKYDRERN